MNRLIAGILGVVAGTILALMFVAAAFALDDACKITDANGAIIRSTDCFGALLRVETDKFIYVRVHPDGFEESTPQNSSGPNLYFTAPGCAGEPLMYSVARSSGYFFEPTQWVDDTHFWYAMWKGQVVGGTAILSWWIGGAAPTCYDTAGWWDDSTVFASLAQKPRSHFHYVPPFKLSR